MMSGRPASGSSGGLGTDMAGAAPNDSAFKALSDPTRREILRLLSGGPMTAGQIGERFSISQPAVSRHLAVLRQAELLTARREGANVIYEVDTTVFQDVVRVLLDLVPSAASLLRSKARRKLART